MRKATVCIGFLMAFVVLAGAATHAELIAHWPMDEGSGKEIGDVVGKGGVGTFVGSPTWVEGKMEGALECSAGNYIRIPGNPDIESPSVTATMWINFNDVAPPRQDFLSKNDDYALSLHEWADDGTIYPIIRSPANAWTVASGTVKIEAGLWYHVALVYDGDSEDLVSYIDGVEDSRGVAPGGIGQSGGALTLGDYNNRPLRGVLDEVKIWNEALSEEDIQNDITDSMSVDSRGKLVALWGRIKLSGQR